MLVFDRAISTGCEPIWFTPRRWDADGSRVTSHRLLLAFALAGIALAAFVPAVALSESAPPGTVIKLVTGGRSTTMSEATLEKTVRAMTAAAARKAMIIVSVNEQIVKEAPASSYRDFVINADRNMVMATIRATLPDIESYNADNVPHGSHDPDKSLSRVDSGYAGMTLARLVRYDSAVLHEHVVLVRASRTSYCVQSTLHGQTAFKNGPSAAVALGHC